MKFDPAEMSMILEQAKRYTDSQRLGYTEKKVLTYDGNVEDREYIDNARYMVKVSDKTINLKSVEKIVCTATDFTLTLEKKDLRVAKLDDHIQSLNGYYGTTEGYLVLVYDYGEDDLLTGTYLLGFDSIIVEGSNTLTGWVSYVELETIHPIPQEYIPPLDRLILNGTDGNQYALTIADGALSVAPVTT